MSELIILKKDEEQTTFAIGDVSTVKTSEIPEAVEALKKTVPGDVPVSIDEAEKAFSENVESIERDYKATVQELREEYGTAKNAAVEVLDVQIQAEKTALFKAVEDAMTAYDAAVKLAISKAFSDINAAQEKLEFEEEKALTLKENLLGEVSNSYDQAKAAIERAEAERENHEKELKVYEALAAAPVEKEEVVAPVEEKKAEPVVVVAEKRKGIRF